MKNEWIFPPEPLTTGQWSDQALRILAERYLHRRPDGTQETPEELVWRVAHSIAEADQAYGADDGVVMRIAQEFYELIIKHEFVPNSPTLMNAGLGNNLQYSACYVLPIEDSIEGIFESVKNAAIVHQSGGGTGFAFSRLRPNGSRVNASGGIASGPVSFMRVFDAATEAIKQGGRRRGANMGILRVDHPDIEEFITCKLDGGITNFNISVAITEAFMKALETDGRYDLIAQPGWPRGDGSRYEGGEVIGYRDARFILGKIVDAAWKSGDPGLVFIDRINDSPANPTPEIGLIEATNPCGEAPLLPNEACNLGSINLSKFINTRGDGLDWEALAKTIRTAVHFLDNVITVNPYPLPEINQAVKDNRRIGLGPMGWADLLFALEIAYDCDDALILAYQVMNYINIVGHKKSEELAKKRGSFPNWKHSIYSDGPLMRNSTVTTIAPTGSISIIAGASSGIEPIFALAYQHIVKQQEGGERVLTFINPIFERVAKERGFWSDELKAKVLERGSVHDLPEVPEDIRNIFVTAHEVEPHWHVRMQAGFQKHTDNGVSKTINLPNTATRQDIEAAYLLAYQTGCLGITVFRDGCKDTQVLHVGAQKETAQTAEKTETINAPQPVSKTPKIRPVSLNGNTYRKKTPVGTAYITVNANGGGDKEPFEVFINVGKAGSDVAADAEGLGRLISLILRLPGPLSAFERAKDIIAQLRGIGSGRAQGFGPNRVMSLADAVAQALAEHVGLNAIGDLPGLPDVDEDPQLPLPLKTGDLCPECGQATFVFEEGCKKCHGCGYSEC
jgi:ribonucleoside-diphosphate reductase alpha chain